jgi:hypothetical protein
MVWKKLLTEMQKSFSLNRFQMLKSFQPEELLGMFLVVILNCSHLSSLFFDSFKQRNMFWLRNAIEFPDHLLSTAPLQSRSSSFVLAIARVPTCSCRSNLNRQRQIHSLEGTVELCRSYIRRCFEWYTAHRPYLQNSSPLKNINLYDHLV